MPAAPAPAPAPPAPGAGPGPRRHRARPAWPVALAVALAALSWAAVSSLQVAAPAQVSDAAMRLVSSSTSEPPRDAVVPSARASVVSALRVTVDALVGTAIAIAPVLFGSIVIVLAAVALVRDARVRWWARLVGAPPVLDVHPV